MLPFLLILAGFLVYLYFALSTPHWYKFNIPYLKPNPFFGNLTDIVFQRSSLAEVYKGIYEKFKNTEYVGIYVLRRPGILIRNLELVKNVLVKDFQSFHDNDMEVDPDLDPIFGNNPFTMKGEEWKLQRIKHTPMFTTGKMKNMLEAVEQTSNKMVKYISEQITKNSCMEAMDITAKYTITNFGSCAIGIDNKTFEESNSEMRRMGKDLAEISFANSLKQIVMMVFPSLFDFFGATFVPPKIYKRLKEIVTEQIDYRKRNNVERNDFLDNVRTVKGQDAPITEVMSQVGGFFVDAFATSSHAMNFMFYELAKNVEVQEILRKEVDDTLTKNNGNITYEILNDMPYLEGVILEALRKYPPLGFLTKVCTAPYTFLPATLSSSPLKIEVGTPIVIPITGIHYDEKYFKNPTDFDPTRFLPENRGNIEKYAYIPFGVGPRVCLGKKFALMQIKMCLLKLVQHFELKVNKKTKEPIVLHPAGVLIAAKGGIWLDITSRTK